MSRLRDQMALDFLAVSPATIFNSGAIGTSPVKAPDAVAVSGSAVVRQLTIVNKSSTAHAAYYLTSSEASPSFVASAASVLGATEGIVVFPSSKTVVNCHGNMSLWLVASAASTALQVVCVERALH